MMKICRISMKVPQNNGLVSPLHRSKGRKIAMYKLRGRGNVTISEREIFVVLAKNIGEKAYV